MIYCEIIDRGKVYPNFYDKAIELGADVDKKNPRNKKSKHKWKYDERANTGNLCVLVSKANYHSYEICLVERLKDNKQFVIGEDGIKITIPILDDKLFEI